MPSGGYFTTGGILAFMLLAVIRGSFSPAIYFAVHAYRSPSLVFLLRTPGTIFLYLVTVLFLSRRSNGVVQGLRHTSGSISSLWRCAVMGLLHLAAPYLLFMYALKILNPTVAGVYMAAAPWLSTVIERLPCIQHKQSLTAVKVFAMILGFSGVIMVSVADGVLALTFGIVPCPLTSHAINASQHQNSSQIEGHTNCGPFTHAQVITAMLALIGGALLWAISSVFWKAKNEDIHYTVAGIWNNLFAGLYGLVIFGLMFIFEPLNKVQWLTKGGNISILFLTVMCGWLAAIIVDYLYKAVGPVSTNRVICLVPLLTWLEDWMFIRHFSNNIDTPVIVLEVLGLVLVFVGLVSSSLETEGFRSSLRTPLLDPAQYQRSDEPFREDIPPDMDDLVTSEEEVENDNNSRPHSRLSHLHTNEDLFPPLVEVTGDCKP
ncbi:uncharacterized protein LOC116602188 [Nematostella vectensis]|uniref:uncharacterized protein LOC116602188 n=1 Tax=Nematostella vectensis TaxID=45351 RepID=UPI00139051AE|nr:uncharacterized protein LOC116602188 [Nematostella vectensis]